MHLGDAVQKQKATEWQRWSKVNLGLLEIDKAQLFAVLLSVVLLFRRFSAFARGFAVFSPDWIPVKSLPFSRLKLRFLQICTGRSSRVGYWMIVICELLLWMMLDVFVQEKNVGIRRVQLTGQVLRAENFADEDGETSILRRRWEWAKIFVGENLSYENEKIYRFKARELANYEEKFGMNVVILKK